MVPALAARALKEKAMSAEELCEKCGAPPGSADCCIGCKGPNGSWISGYCRVCYELTKGNLDEAHKAAWENEHFARCEGCNYCS